MAQRRPHTQYLLELMTPLQSPEGGARDDLRPTNCRHDLPAHAPRRKRDKAPARRSSLRRHRRLPSHACGRLVAADDSRGRRQDTSLPAVVAAERPRGSWGLSDDFRLPERYNDAYHVCGDGVCVPVVRHIAERTSRAALAMRNGPPGSSPQNRAWRPHSQTAIDAVKRTSQSGLLLSRGPLSRLSSLRLSVGGTAKPGEAEQHRSPRSRVPGRTPA